MLDMQFLVIDKEGVPINHGKIKMKVTQGNYLCRFERHPVCDQVCSIEQIRGWLLFDNNASLDQYVKYLKQQREQLRAMTKAVEEIESSEEGETDGAEEESESAD